MLIDGEFGYIAVLLEASVIADARLRDLRTLPPHPLPSHEDPLTWPFIEGSFIHLPLSAVAACK